MKNLSISEFASIFNVSRQSLIYYDKIDLFKPATIDTKTGYRKYNYNQFSKFALIKFLRNLGFSISKIREITDSEDIGSIRGELLYKSKQIEEEHRRLTEINDIIQRKLDFVEESLKEVNFSRIEIKKAPRKVFYLLGYEENAYNNSLFFHYPTFVIYELQKDENSYKKIFGGLIDTKYIKKEYEEYVESVEESLCLCCYFKGNYDEIPDFVRSLSKKYPSYNFADDFYCINIIDQFLDNNPKNFITEIQVPVL